MNTELLIDRFSVLPEHLQIQVFDYIEFLIEKYVPENTFPTIEQPENEAQQEISPELKDFLEARIASHENNKEGALSYQELEEKLIKKYGYEL